MFTSIRFGLAKRDKAGFATNFLPIVHGFKTSQSFLINRKQLSLEMSTEC